MLHNLYIKLHTHYRTDRLVFPVGYAARRRGVDPRRPDAEFLCEILEGVAGPVFRVSEPEAPAARPATGRTATAAWSQVRGRMSGVLIYMIKTDMYMYVYICFL